MGMIDTNKGHRGRSPDGVGLGTGQERREEICQSHTTPVFSIDPQHTDEDQDTRYQYDERILDHQTHRIAWMGTG